MENLHQQMLERCKTLVHKEVEIAEEERKLELTKHEIRSELQAAKTYI